MVKRSSAKTSKGFGKASHRLVTNVPTLPLKLKLSGAGMSLAQLCFTALSHLLGFAVKPSLLQMILNMELG